MIKPVQKKQKSMKEDIELYTAKIEKKQAALFISDMIPVRQIFSLIHHSSQEALHGASKLGLKA